MTTRRKLAWFAWVISSLLLLVLIAWGGWSFVVHKIAARERAPHLETLKNTTQAPNLSFQTLDGEQRHLADFKGKVVLLDLWGTWCIQCVAEMPTLQHLYDHYRNDPKVQLLIVSRWDSPAKVKSYAKRNQYDLPFFVTEDADIPPAMQLHQFPSTFLIDRNGNLVAQHTGAADWSSPSVVNFIEDLKRE